MKNGADGLTKSVVGAFQDGDSGMMQVAARLRRIAGTRWETRRYLNKELHKEIENDA